MIRSDDGRGGREPWSGRKRGERADALPRVELVAVDAFQLEWTTVEKKDAFKWSGSLYSWRKKELPRFSEAMAKSAV